MNRLTITRGFPIQGEAKNENQAASRFMDTNFELLESYVNRKISHLDFHQALVGMGYPYEDRLLIKQFAASLQIINF